MFLGDDHPHCPRTPRDLALVGRLALRLREGEDVRGPVVERIRAALATEDYENELKLSVAAERLMEELLPARH